MNERIPPVCDILRPSTFTTDMLIASTTMARLLLAVAAVLVAAVNTLTAAVAASVCTTRSTVSNCTM